MLHQPASHFAPPPSPPPQLNTEGRPIFDAAAYIDAMRAAGAHLEPRRGTPGGIDLDGTFTIVLPPGAAARKRVEAVEAAFAGRRAIDRAAAGRIAEALLMQAAARRFASVVGRDFDRALRELARLDDVLTEASELEESLADRPKDDPARIEASRAADLACEQREVACDYIRAMPIRRHKDIARKALFGLKYCNMGEEFQAIVREIATYSLPERCEGVLPAFIGGA